MYVRERADHADDSNSKFLVSRSTRRQRSGGSDTRMRARIEADAPSSREDPAINIAALSTCPRPPGAPRPVGNFAGVTQDPSSPRALVSFTLPARKSHGISVHKFPGSR
ncbi:hypothetical protein X777_02876 [Ooceraea biroi]|uniref:Uncharacterized protein n=1 Tax=Ooceraea biroi TaxID=2015173 RepID=A0A026WJW7_OOCBI|nr:hypothetical protein X777_02876 [Ooceraea biroi]